MVRRFFNLFLLLALLFPTPAPAADAEKAFRQARKSYQDLLDAPKKKLYRENWLKVIAGLQEVTRANPGSPRAPEALFIAAKAGAGLYDVSQVKSDAEQAVELFAESARSYPASSLADDALVRAAALAERIGDFPLAYGFYAEALERYPKGDQAAVARKKVDELGRFASQPKTRPKSATPSGSPPSAPAPVPSATGAVVEMTGIRFWSNPGYTRVSIGLSGNAEFTSKFLPGNEKSLTPPRLYLDIARAQPAAGVAESTPVEDGLLRRIRAGRPDPETARVVLDLQSFRDYKVFTLPDPWRIVIDIAGDRSPELKTAKSTELRSLPPEPGDRIARVLEQAPAEQTPKVQIPSAASQSGLRRIVVDAGHGGKDPGAIGPSGLQEKQVTLAMAKALARKLEQEFGCEVILTRADDTFLPLEERTAIANKVGADLFISVHANAAPNREAHGIETYYLNFAKSDKAAAVVARENGTSLKQVGDLELILFDLMANSKINESSHLANEIQKSLVDGLGNYYPDVRDLGVRQGPFYVLLGATMPSVLVEAAFISHQREESRLSDPKYHQRTAAAIVQGVRSYASSLKLIAANDLDRNR